MVVSAFGDAKAVLISAAAQVPADRPPALRDAGGAADRLVRRGIHLRGLWMWGPNGKDRPALRKVASAALGPAALAPLGTYLADRASDLLDASGQEPDFDLIAEFARPLVRDSLMELIGIAPAQRAALDVQIAGMAGFLPGCAEPGTGRYFALAAIAQAVEDLWRKPLPPRAAASQILRGAVEAEKISLDEALAQATLLLFGNSYTTLDAFAGLLERLAPQPELWAAARGGAAALPSLVEESLRLGPPRNLVLLREADDDIACPSGIIPAGANIVLPLDTLNRDTASFPNADNFEPNRTGPPHLAFGAGRHMCVGLHLARAVIRTGVEALLERLTEWPGQIRVERAPSMLGGQSISVFALPRAAVQRC